MAHLLFSRGVEPVFRVVLHNSSTKIGRSPQCDIVLAEPEISREHAALYKIEKAFHLKKLGQAALTVNGKETESQTLKDGDRIELGPWTVTFDAKEAATAPAEDTLGAGGPSLGSTHAIAKGPRGLWVKELSLQIEEPGKASRSLRMSSESLSLGAGEKNDVVLQDPYLSSRHAKLTLREGRLWVHDLGSTNGTFLNGVKVREAELEEGQILKIGQCELRISSEERVESAGPKNVDRFQGMVGGSLQMRELYGLLEKVGPTEASVLILGESGTGKELVARAVHQLSARRRGPLVAINCGAISAELIESELFGHEKGAFTGALRQHDGAFGQARGGTLFLDEVGELPLELQPKLLRVLENRTYRRVGGIEELSADVRVVAATHRDLAKAVQEKRFREDLFFRLFVMPVYLPPLRDRKEDIALLCESFLKEFASGSGVKELSPAGLARVREHLFPGNVRELRNLLLRAMILASGPQIEPQDLVFPNETGSVAPSAGVPLESLEEMEKRLVLKALMASSWNKARAAETLGVAKSTLFAKIKLYGLKDPREES
ncbi:MAG TPA: sigma 54-interacting transcriptional regulator [bacterium]|nr:sigma 54-interacting transcriptional regulator [bacterium]